MVATRPYFLVALTLLASSAQVSCGGSPSGGNGGSNSSSATSWPKPCADLYDQSKVPTFDLIISKAEFDGLKADCASTTQRYRPVTLRYGTEEIEAQVRLKGNWTWRCDKMQFVVSFNETDSEGRFHGLRKLTFDAPWYDRTLLHERMAFSIFKKRELPYSCVNNARININGEYYGLFANIEHLDKEYLQRNFAEAEGNLYQAGKDLKTNESANQTSDRDAYWAVRSFADLEPLVDLNEAVEEWAVEALLPAMDNYWAGVEINFYLYNHPSRGFLYLPYDMDLVFGDGSNRDGSLLYPKAATVDPITYEHPEWKKERHVQLALANPLWCSRFVEALTRARAAYDPTGLAAQIDTWAAQIEDSVADDPRKVGTLADHQAAVTALKSFFAKRAAFVDQWLAAGNHCPAKP